MKPTPSIETQLRELFDAERAVRRLHADLCQRAQGELVDAVRKAIVAATAEPDEAEASLRLVRLAALLGEFEGPRVVDALIDIVATEHEEARRTAGEELEALAFERFKEVAEGFERAYKRLPVGSPALAELPYIIGEVPEPGVAKLLALALGHDDADAVAAAIEMAVETGDSSLAKHLERLRDDKRTVELADDVSGDTEITIGELASEALSLLGEIDAAFDQSEAAKGGAEDAPAERRGAR